MLRSSDRTTEQSGTFVRLLAWPHDLHGSSHDPSTPYCTVSGIIWREIHMTVLYPGGLTTIRTSIHVTLMTLLQ